MKNNYSTEEDGELEHNDMSGIVIVFLMLFMLIALVIGEIIGIFQPELNENEIREYSMRGL